MDEKMIKLPQVTCSYGYDWTLKSTMPERGDVLLGLGLEWGGWGDDPVSVDDVVNHGIEQVANLLVAVRTHAGEKGVLEVLSAAMASYHEEIAGE